MAKDHIGIVHELGDGIRALKEGLPDVMKAFGALGVAAYKPGKLDTKVKELIALAIGITVRCDGCVAYHSKAAYDKGASREELLEAIGVAIQMGGGPSMVYGVDALKAYDQFDQV